MHCSFCGELAQREIRSRRLDKRKHGFSYRYQFWKCSGCGREWEDGAMRAANRESSWLGTPTPIDLLDESDRVSR